MTLIMINSALGLLTPWPFKYLIDYSLNAQTPPEWLIEFVGAEDFRYKLLYWCAGVEVLIIFLFQVLGIFETYVATRLDQRIDRDFRGRLFAHAMNLSLAYHDRTRSGMLIYLINSQGGAVAGLLLTLPSIIQSLVMLVGMVVILCTMHWGLALISVVVIPSLFFASKYYATKMQDRIMATKEKEGLALSVILEAISMMRVIVAFGRQKLEHERYLSTAQVAMDSRLGVTLRQTVFSLVIRMSTGIGRAFAWTFGGLLTLAGRLTVGDLTIVLYYIDRVYDPLETLAYTYSGWQDQFASFRACFEMLDTQPDVADAENPVPLPSCQGQLEFQHVDFSYEGRVDTLKDITFLAKPGQVTAVVGPTGAGKTTLISLIPRFYNAAQGTILLDGIDVKNLSLAALRQQVSIVLQEPLLFSMTIRENIRYGRLDATDEQIFEAARAANAHDFIMKLPQQYDTELGERGARLSGGERQRICVARAFLKNAPILILDEPTSSIDSKTEAVILDSLDRLMEGRTTFMIAHRLSTIRRADWILVMDQGRIVEQGPHDQLLANNGLYKQLHDLQHKQAERKAAARAIWSSV